MNSAKPFQLFQNYRTNSSTYDEAVDANGLVRPAFQKLAEQIYPLDFVELQRRWEVARRQISEEGVTYNPHDASGGVSRPWVLDPIPLVIEESDWAALVDGLKQRALLADLVVLDLFGPQTLLQERIVPPEVLYGHPDYFPAYHTLTSSTKRHLQLYAADVVRSPNGQWMATADRTRSPFGLGYILENRLIASRILPSAFRNCNVQRLASFFITLRETLRGLASRHPDNPRIAMWTKGPSSRSYAEDSLLARYLGYTLVEGGDLAVRENRVVVKTLGGLLPVEVLFRRLEDHLADPVELYGTSDSGIPGLLEVIRSGGVSVANALGTAIAESPIIMPFLPGICRHFLNQELRLPSIQSWWCGDASAMQFVLNNFDQVQFRPAFRSNRESVIQTHLMSADEKEAFRKRLLGAPRNFVAEELVTRSTTPVLHQGQLQPWYVAIRTFLVANGGNYDALPGALARVSPNPDSLSHNMSSGERSQDVWVLSQTMVEPVTLLGTNQSALTLKRSGADLTSRAGDNLFWLGRYLERAEQLARLARTTLQVITNEQEQSSAVESLIRACVELGLVPDARESDKITTLSQSSIGSLIPESILDPNNPQSLRSAVSNAIQIASSVRDRISLDALRVMYSVDTLLVRPQKQLMWDASDVLGVLDSAIISFCALAGLSSENMTRTQGWRLLDIGRRIERSMYTSQILKTMLTVHCKKQNDAGVLEAVLQVCDSLMTYRSRYLSNFQFPAVLDLLLTDDSNPRSLGFQLETIVSQLEKLPRNATQAQLPVELRLSMSLSNAVKLADVFELSQVDTRGDRLSLARLLIRIYEQLPKLANEISGRFLIHAGTQRYFASANKEIIP
jgi:uncharacterized circularly permuted ATP-grasp superfamily protein/uncharacterized alpha-E superfamily protein